MHAKLFVGSRGAALHRPALASAAARACNARLLDVPTAAIVAEAASNTISLDALGSDIFTFLAASVLVVPLSRYLNVTPVLGFLALGCAIGPYGLGFFSNSEADLQLGDFGIVFLLFIEGLQLSPDRLQKLGGFFQLGLAQFLLTIATLTAANLYLGPQILETAERFIRLDDNIVRLILTSPVVAFTLAGAGALSSSAFVLPVLKQKGWEDRADGTAALAVLLLQDIAVAPLLVILPLIAGSGPQSGPELGILLAKGTFGFGAVLAVGSVVLRQIFNVVAATRSSETFVAAALLVAVGMGAAAQELGLSTTTGAFAAGVLLAGSQYRQQIEADIKPFEGILLGIFFMTAGANLDPGLCIAEWPTLLSGIIAFLAAKLGLIFALGAFAFGLSRAEAIRIALLLAGGGEFAFVVFKLAETLGLLEPKLSNLLTASVILSMSLTPLLGELAEYVGEQVERIDAGQESRAQADALFAVIDADGNGSIEREELRAFLLGGGGGGRPAGESATPGDPTGDTSFERLFELLDLDGDGVISREELRAGYTELIIGEVRDAALKWAATSGVETQYDPANADEQSNALTTSPDAVIVCGYGEMGQGTCDVLAGIDDGGGVRFADLLRDEVALPSGLWSTHFIAFDRNPSRISIGLAKAVRVVYGDGASASLIQAAGVSRPRAIVITYANDKRCLEATSRLREAFPAAPIYVRARTASDAEPLLAAGATDVVVEAVESVVRLASLLGAGAETADTLLRAPLSTTGGLGGGGGRWGGSSSRLPYPEEELESLAEECGITRTQIGALYDGWALLEANDDGEVELGAVRAMLEGSAADLLTPIEDDTLDDELERWMADADGDGSNTLSFFEYVRVDARLSATSGTASSPK